MSARSVVAFRGEYSVCVCAVASLDPLSTGAKLYSCNSFDDFRGVVAMFAVALVCVCVPSCVVSLAADSCSRPQLVATCFMHDNKKDRLVGLNFPGCSCPSLAWFIEERLVTSHG